MGPGRKPEDQFSHNEAQTTKTDQICGGGDGFTRCNEYTDFAVVWLIVRVQDALSRSEGHYKLP